MEKPKINVDNFEKIKHGYDEPHRSHHNHKKIDGLDFLMCFFPKLHFFFLGPRWTFNLLSAFNLKLQDQKRQGVQVFLFSCLFLTVSGLAYAVQPVPFGQITSTPGWRKDPFGSGRLVHHNGYDIAVPIGTTVTPTQAGTVSFAGKYKGYGLLVVVDHGNSYISMYGHLSRILVKAGTPVTTETVLALSGNTGHSTGPHLHYEIRQWPGAQYVQVYPDKSSLVPVAKRDEDEWVERQLAAPTDRNMNLDKDGWFHGLE